MLIYVHKLRANDLMTSALTSAYFLFWAVIRLGSENYFYGLEIHPKDSLEINACVWLSTTTKFDLKSCHNYCYLTIHFLPFKLQALL